MTKFSIKDDIGKATLIIGVFSLLAKILGFARDAILANHFGRGVIVDAYFAAFRLPDFIYNLLILGTLSVAFIPVFSEYLQKDKDEADRLASTIINVTLLGMLVLSILAFIFVDPLVSLIAPGFTGESRNLTKLFTQIFLLSPILFSLSSIVSSILNTYRRFAIMALAQVIYGLAIILGIVWFYPIWGPIGLALGVVLGAFLHLIIQIPDMFALGFKYHLVLNFDEGFYKFWKLYWPRIFSMGTVQISLLVTTFFGSFLGTGALAAVYYANNLQSVFLSIFAISASIAVFPAISDYFNQKNEEGFKDVLAKTTIQILYFMIPISVLMLVLRAQIVRLVLGAGQGTKFSFADTRVVALTLGLFVVSLFAQSLIPLFTRAFYARRNTMVPVITSLVTIAVNIFATYWLVHKFGIAGMAMAFSLSTIIQLVLLVAELHYKIGNIRDEYLILNTLKIVISSVVCGLLSYISLYIIAPLVNMQTYWGIATQGVLAGLVGVVAFLAVSLFSRLDETRNILSFFRSFGKKLLRPADIITNIWD